VILKVTEFSFFRKFEGKVEKNDNTGGRSETTDEWSGQEFLLPWLLKLIDTYKNSLKTHFRQISSFG
jgi:hypothetical protein